MLWQMAGEAHYQCFHSGPFSDMSTCPKDQSEMNSCYTLFISVLKAGKNKTLLYS